MGLSTYDQNFLLEAAPMHDIGKVSIADTILIMPRRLDGDEFEIMKQHALYGYEILKREFIASAARWGCYRFGGIMKNLMAAAIPADLKGRKFLSLTALWLWRMCLMHSLQSGRISRLGH